MRWDLSSLFSPRSLAVVGVSSHTDSLSGRLLGNLCRAGYKGEILPVNPKVRELFGLPCYPNVSSLPTVPDLAIIMVRRDAALGAVEQCLARGIRTLVLITAGFREGGVEGAKLEQAILERVQAAGAVMLGPNCMGLVNTDPAVCLDATFSPVPALPGGVAFAAHSGALGVAFFEQAREAGLGISLFVSLGNSAMVNVVDALEAFGVDERTRAIMLYLETIEEPRRFLQVAQELSRKKPIVVLKAGRTEVGQRAASSHTGAMAAPDRAVDALLRQAGCVRAETLRQLLDWARTFERVSVPRGKRVAVVSNAGGPAIAACDAVARNGWELPELALSTQAQLRELLPPEAAVANPVDMLPSAQPEDFRRALEVVAADPSVDAVVSITVTPPLQPPMEVAKALASAPRSLPFLPVFMTSPEFYPEASLIPNLPPVFRFPEEAVAALVARWEADRFARRRQVAPPAPCLSAKPSHADGFLPASQAFQLVAEAGIPVAAYAVTETVASLPQLARQIGYPVVLKAYGSQLVHKTELKAVALGLASEAELIREAERMSQRLAELGVKPEGFLVQQYLAEGRELILGVSQDPVMGPLVLCGLGGVAVEAWQDVSFRLAPCSREDAWEMLEELRGKAILEAFRGYKPADKGAVVDAIVKLSALAEANPEIVECDINPLLVFPSGVLAVDVRVRWVPR